MAAGAYSVTSVLRALDVLEFLAQQGGAGRVSDIAAALRCSKNTAFRLLKTLQQRGYVRQADDASYELTFKLLNLGECVLRTTDLHAVARPYLEALNQQCRETVSLGILDGHEIVYLDRVLGTQPYHTSYSVGARTTEYEAFSPGPIVDGIIEAGLAPKTDNTITDPERLRADLRMTVTRGYAYDNQESVLGIRCIAAPVFDRKKDVVAAISVSALAARVTDGYAETLAGKLISTTAALSARLGYPGALGNAVGAGQRDITTTVRVNE
jgi:DNA-binding IclR family transcriptional regulator